jgi:hypothetical protein
MLKKFFGLVIIILLPAIAINSQSQQVPQNINKPAPKQQGIATSNSPPITTQHQKGANNQQQIANKPISIVEKNKPIVKDDTTKKNYNYETDNLKVQRELAKSTKTIADFTIALVITTIVLALISLWQGWFSRKALTSTQRAFVSMKEIIVHKVLSDQGEVIGYGFFVRLENSGNTPAIEMSHQITRKISDSSTAPLSTDYNIIKIQYNTLGARSTIDIGPLDIPIDDIIAIYNRKKFLYIYGIITFTDVMQNIHTEKFCREVGVIVGDPSSPQPGVPIFTFTGHPTNDNRKKK